MGLSIPSQQPKLLSNKPDRRLRPRDRSERPNRAAPGPRWSGCETQRAKTLILGKLQSDHVVYLAIEEGPQTIRYSANVGDSKPLHSSSIGKATLAQLERAALLSKLELPRVTPNTITARDVLEADLEVGRRRGFFVTRGENVGNVMGMAIAIDTGTGPVGIAVAGPLIRMEDNFER